MSTEVNWKELFSNPKNAFNCTTEKEAKQLLRIAHDLGYTWCTGDSFLIDNNIWNFYRNETSYAIGIGEYATGEFYSGKGYTVYEFSKLIKTK
jgi:hypothetical protein